MRVSEERLLRDPDGHTPMSVRDVEFYHPLCRRRVIVTDFWFRREHKRGDCTLEVVEGICLKCDRYVRLRLGAV